MHKSNSNHLEDSSDVEFLEPLNWTQVKQEREEDEDDGDPLSLLQQIDERAYEENMELRLPETDGDEDAGNDSDTSQSNNASDADEFWLEAMTKFPWLFHDTARKNYGYCLYCDAFLKCDKYYESFLVKHSKTCIHIERQEEYTDFLDMMKGHERRFTMISSNRDTDEDAVLIKEKRKTYESELQSFLWERWTNAHSWLVCDKEAGYVSYCKYCHTNCNAITSRLRKTHEESQKHIENSQKIRKRRATVCADAESVKRQQMESEIITPDNEQIEINDAWIEIVKDSPLLCRCKLCDITMFTKSFARHSGSNLHRQNMTAIDSPGVSAKLEKPNWLALTSVHPWIKEDPNNGMEAFCLYCDKRLSYGSSAAKRLIHEHSASHRQAQQEYNNNAGKVKKSPTKEALKNNNTDEGDEEVDDNAVEESEEQNNDNDDTEKDKKIDKKYIIKRRMELLKRFDWAKIYKKNRRYIACKYCKVLLNVTWVDTKHAKTKRHKDAETNYFASQQTNNSTKIEVNENLFPWLEKVDNQTNCRYCMVVISTNHRRHERTSRHLDAVKEFSLKQQQKPTDSTSKKKTEAKPTPVKVEKEPEPPKKESKQEDKNWKKRFIWLGPRKATMPNNYGFCKYCKKAVYAATPGLAAKHQRSSTHVRAYFHLKRSMRIEKQAVEKDNNVEIATKKSANHLTDEPALKRFKPSAIRKATETAKRLTEAHMEILRLVRSVERNKFRSVSNGLLSTLMPMELANKERPKVPSTPTPSLELTTDSFTAQKNRDPFDLFFSSMSESAKRLPVDLASEAKLKVMNIIYELEVRAQGRESMDSNSSALNTSQHVAQTESVSKLKTTSTPASKSNSELNLNDAFQLSSNNSGRSLLKPNDVTTANQSRQQIETINSNGKDDISKKVNNLDSLGSVTIRRVSNQAGSVGTVNVRRPHIHHIQVNSSTQSHIIPLDMNGYKVFP